MPSPALVPMFLGHPVVCFNTIYIVYHQEVRLINFTNQLYKSQQNKEATLSEEKVDVLIVVIIVMLIIIIFFIFLPFFFPSFLFFFSTRNILYRWTPIGATLRR